MWAGVTKHVIPIFQRKLSLNRAAFLISDITKTSELFKLFRCLNNTNGAVVNDMGERRHHVGRQAKAVEDSFALYSDETMEAEDKAFLLKLRDTTMAAIDETRFAQIVNRLRDSTEAPITGKVQDVVQLTAQNYGINSDEQEGILKYLIEGGDLSLYGLSNAVTRASQDVESYDRATALEGIGWQVATMPATQWKGNRPLMIFPLYLHSVYSSCRRLTITIKPFPALFFLPSSYHIVHISTICFFSRTPYNEKIASLFCAERW